MSRRREWVRTFADPAVLSDLFAAARSCMREICEAHDPSGCDCPDNMMTPLEFAEWLEREIHVDNQRPARFEPGQRPRRKEPMRVNLAMAG